MRVESPANSLVEHVLAPWDMKAKLLCLAVVCLGLVTAYEIKQFRNRQRIDWSEGHMSAFPDGKHVVYVRSGRSDEGRDYCQIFIFDAIRYPDLSEPNHPDDLEENNPLASYLLPVPIHARSTEFEFATSGRQVTIKQPAMDDMPSMQYEIHLDNFSLPRHGTPVDAP